MTKAPIDGVQFRDQDRLRSSEVARAFATAIRAIAQGPRSELSERDKVPRDVEAAVSDTEIVRGVD